MYPFFVGVFFIDINKEKFYFNPLVLVSNNNVCHGHAPQRGDHATCHEEEEK